MIRLPAFDALNDPALLTKIISRCTRNGDCLEWQGERNKDGYGRLRVAGHKESVHRVVAAITQKRLYIMGFDTIFVCHTCDNPPCCAAEHLVIADAKFNSRDTVNKGRHVPSGTPPPPGRKLTSEQAREIYLSYKQIGKYTQVANLFNVNPSTVWCIVKGITYIEIIRD